MSVLVDSKFIPHKQYDLHSRRFIVQKVQGDEVYKLIVYKTDKPGYGICSKLCEMFLTEKRLQEILTKEKVSG